MEDEDTIDVMIEQVCTLLREIALRVDWRKRRWDEDSVSFLSAVDRYLIEN